MPLTHRFILNLVAMTGLLAGGLLSLLPSSGVPAELQGALWGALIAWLAATRTNGS